MVVRPATVGDERLLAELNAVVQQMHREVSPQWFKPPDNEAAVAYFKELLRSDAFRIFVAEADGEGLGYALARLHDVPETALTYGGLVVELDQIVVHPACRGRGLGSELIGQVKALASELGATSVQLTVWEFNTHARTVFERAGFRTAMRRMLAD